MCGLEISVEIGCKFCQKLMIVMKYFIFWKTKACQTVFSCETVSTTLNWTERIKEMDPVKVIAEAGFNNAMQRLF